MDKLVVIKFNGALGTSLGFGGPKHEKNTQLLAILAYCVHGLDSSVCTVQHALSSFLPWRFTPGLDGAQLVGFTNATTCSSPLLLLFSPLLSFVGLVFVRVLVLFVAAATTLAFRRSSGFIRRSGGKYFWVLARDCGYGW
ncbi:hypothetical protein M0R45_031012 [Rubus argutus]|uniref:Uncharacterized protein n=1 Tax=Rubus argutus TaxID=59490 RepID=A0AAW1WF69_RUBAR